MADTMQFDLVSPERLLASMQVSAVLIPGADGDMTAMPDHAPVITTLRPGLLRVETDKGTEEFVVSGGFAQIGDGLSVLAEKAFRRADVTQDAYDAMMDDAQAVYDDAKGKSTTAQGVIDDAAKLLADMVAVGTELGLSTRQPSL
jgi:F-type H+-transporting ATPase subunit epsilon